MRTSTAPSTTSIVVAGLVAVAAYVAATFLTIDATPYDLWGAMLIGPVLIVVTLPILAREARRQEDPRLFWFLFAALIAKILGSLLRYYVTFDVYRAADAVAFHRNGVVIAENFWNGIYSTGLHSLSGTNFMSFFTGVVYIVTGPSKLGGFLVYSWLSFLGLFLFYRAFVLAVPQGDRRWYGWLVFFVPSLLYWPSSTGKEAWMMLTLGIASFGVARLLTGRVLRGTLLLAAGTLLAAIVRPHVGGLLAIGAVASILVLRPRKSWGRVGPLLKWVGVVGAVALSVVLIGQTQQFLGSDLSSATDLVSELEQTSTRSDTGGSAYDAVVVTSPAKLPLAVVTVLFRPFIFEVDNAQSLAAAAESTALLVFVLLRLRWIWAALKSMRRMPYVTFAVVYTAMFVVVFASLPNFGLLARERVQVLPLLFVLLSIPPAGSGRVADGDLPNGRARASDTITR